MEFRLRKDNLNVVTLSFSSDYPYLTNNIKLENFIGTSKYDVESIQRILHLNNVLWEVDKIMSNNVQTNYVTEKGIHITFDLTNLGRITKVGALYTVRNKTNK